MLSIPMVNPQSSPDLRQRVTTHSRLTPFAFKCSLHYLNWPLPLSRFCWVFISPNPRLHPWTLFPPTLLPCTQDSQSQMPTEQVHFHCCWAMRMEHSQNPAPKHFPQPTFLSHPHLLTQVMATASFPLFRPQSSPILMPLLISHLISHPPKNVHLTPDFHCYDPGLNCNSLSPRLSLTSLLTGLPSAAP